LYQALTAASSTRVLAALLRVAVFEAALARVALGTAAGFLLVFPVVFLFVVFFLGAAFLADAFSA
jgi:hypothetical protein